MDGDILGENNFEMERNKTAKAHMKCLHGDQLVGGLAHIPGAHGDNCKSLQKTTCKVDSGFPVRWRVESTPHQAMGFLLCPWISTIRVSSTFSRKTCAASCDQHPSRWRPLPLSHRMLYVHSANMCQFSQRLTTLKTVTFAVLLVVELPCRGRWFVGRTCATPFAY